MNATLKQTATLSQRLKLSRTMKQSLEILHYSTEELHAFLKGRMEEIPFLRVNFYDGSSTSNGPTVIDQLPSADSGRQALYNRINEQLLNEAINPDVIKAIRWLVDDLDEDGLLPAAFEEYATLIGTSVDVVTEAIRLIQQYGPAGTGAASLQESLWIQAKRNQLSPAAIAILGDHFPSLQSRKWKEIERESGFSANEIQYAVDEIATLRLAPLADILGEHHHYVRPDADIIAGDTIEIRFYKHAFPDLGVDHHYIRELPLDDEKVKRFVLEGTESIEQMKSQLAGRKSTLKLVIEQIAEKQSAYFREGSSSIVPLTMTELAKQLDLHESTISRAIREKYIHTPFGIVPLRQFFSQSATSKNLVEVSPNRVKEKIKGLILGEDKRKPLSDQKIAEQLLTDGIPLSRRVIAKYREQLKIPASSYRKRLN